MMAGTEIAATPPSVVVVDDEPDLLFLLRRSLERAEFRVIGTAEDGQEGIRLATDARPDVLLLDLIMPGLNGEEVLPQIVREAPRTMVAILSAHLDPELASQLLGRGAFAAYEKGDLDRLPGILRNDLTIFRQVLAGESATPAWQRRYREL